MEVSLPSAAPLSQGWMLGLSLSAYATWRQIMLGTEDLAGLQEAGRASVPLGSEVAGIWQSGTWELPVTLPELRLAAGTRQGARGGQETTERFAWPLPSTEKHRQWAERQLHQAASDVSGWSHRKLQDTEDQEMKPQSYPFLHPYPHPDPRVPQRLWRSG
eukprot:XP_006499854.1 PREDICTED: uncharacterized protein LOC329554 isoform X1 [Mus musculus]